MINYIFPVLSIEQPSISINRNHFMFYNLNYPMILMSNSFYSKYSPKIRYLAALKIQKNCYNWLFKVPNGIVFKLAKRHISDIVDF